MEYIRIERDGNIAILRLDRPPVNAVDLGLLRDALEAVDLLSADESVGAMVMTGTGRCFCAGLDLKVVPHYDDARQREYIELTNRVIADIFSAPMPTVAAINGPATAGGFILAMCCDYRLGATGEYPYGVTEARVGIPFPIATLEVLRQELSPPVFRRLMLTGINHPPKTALEWGIIDELVPAEELLIRATAVAADLATLPRGPYNRIKRQVKGDAIDIIEAVIAEGEPMLEMWITPEGMAGAVDMIERQKKR
ncbi:MAG TPA: enoyl-CoA hydratase/isomerase family protein [Candidatus Anoxymicrobiaceae bacterium]